MCLNDTYPFCQQPLSSNCHSICFSKPVLWAATPGWRFSPLIRIVTVYPKICSVIVIGISTTSSRRCDQPPAVRAAPDCILPSSAHSVKKPALPYESALSDASRKRGLRFDPRPDPRTEKPGRKQRRKAYLRVRKSCGKPALFSQNPSEGCPIESSHAGGHWFESSSLHQTLGILMISRVFSFIKKMIVFCFTVLSLYFLSKLIVFYRNEKETLSRLFFHYLSCTFLPLMWSMLMRNIWTALPEAATSSSTIFSVG